jgi:DNA polymerase
MRVVVLADPTDFDGWRAAARSLAAVGIPASDVTWQVGGEQPDLLGALGAAPPAEAGAFSVPRRFVELARAVMQHRDPQRFALLYELLVRIRHTPGLLDDRADPLVNRLEGMERSIGRDVHKMRAFVRFREVKDDEGERFVAWFEPEHHIVRSNADFFARRFANMRWSILTPDLCAHWDGAELDFTPGATRADAPDDDALEATWRTYYASTFNPARLKVRAMTKEMPKKYWRNLPETSLVPGLIASAATRTETMIEKTPMPRAAALTTPSGPDYASLAEAKGAALSCTRCPLYEPATQMVFGEGPADAPLMFVGEAPGDQEDLAGHPFIGPAGKLFNRALAEAGIDRAQAYVTNAVKHFKFVNTGRRRLHQKPEAPEINACRHWLDNERALLKPKVTVALGATAARALLNKVVTISKTRGAPIELSDGSECWVTVHPSFLLRIENEGYAKVEYDRFVQDLIVARERVEALARG